MSVDFNIADVFKLPVKIFAAIALGTGIILFLPDAAIHKLYLTEIHLDLLLGLSLLFLCR